MSYAVTGTLQAPYRKKMQEDPPGRLEDDPEAVTGFLEAARGGDLAFVQRCISQGMPVDITDLRAGSTYRFKRGQTAIHHAAESGHASLVQALATAGAQLNHTNQKQRTALHKACMGNHAGVAEILLSMKASSNCQTQHGMYPVHIAASNGHMEVVRVLNQHQASLDVLTQDQESPLLLATVSGHTEVVEFLLARAPHTVHLPDSGKRCPLHIAANQPQPQIAQLLLENGANPGVRNQSGQTPLDIATQCGNKAMQKLLQEHPAATRPPAVCTRQVSDSQDCIDGPVNGDASLLGIQLRLRPSFVSCVDSVTSTIEDLEKQLRQTPKATTTAQVEPQMSCIRTGMCSIAARALSCPLEERDGLVKEVKALVHRVGLIERQLSRQVAPHCHFLQGMEDMFVEHMLTGTSIHYLVQEGVIDDREREELEAQVTRHKQVILLLNMLDVKPDVDAARLALEGALRVEGQHFLADLLACPDTAASGAT